MYVFVDVVYIRWCVHLLFSCSYVYCFRYFGLFFALFVGFPNKCLKILTKCCEILKEFLISSPFFFIVFIHIVVVVVVLLHFTALFSFSLSPVLFISFSVYFRVFSSVLCNVLCISIYSFFFCCSFSCFIFVPNSLLLLLCTYSLIFALCCCWLHAHSISMLTVGAAVVVVEKLVCFIIFVCMLYTYINFGVEGSRSLFRATYSVEFETLYGAEGFSAFFPKSLSLNCSDICSAEFLSQ